MNELVTEAQNLLSQLIRARSCNPPGDEAAAVAVLGAYLRRSGIDFTVYEAEPGRANLVSRIHGVGDGPSLLLLSHMDTVDADPAEWSSDPWGGMVRDGSVWGRGALDLKGQAAAQAVAVASLLRSGVAFRGDVVLAATADEELGSRCGTRWLLDRHPEALRTDYALTHGAGDRMVLDDRVVYFCATAERVTAELTVTITAPAGLTMLAELPNAIAEAGRLVSKVAGQHVGDTLLEEVAVVMDALAGPGRSPGEVAATAGSIHPALRTLLTPLTGATLVPAKIVSTSLAGRPSVCEIHFDCWLLPGRDRKEIEAVLDAAAVELPYQVAWRPIRGGSRSPTSTPLWGAIESFVRHVDGGSLLLPLCDAGFTDSHWLRERYGTVAYGFFPMREMTTSEAARTVHGPDERMPLSDLALQIDFYRQVITSIGNSACDRQG
ncbi:M20/M25/M40 family metallo-hydrolase [Nonomuraea diastatica]|uniref:M20/M25/M40 family metallo-hydrolase n=1 Tax=Nonomuraea diastatica TaxID=1848329 RepID=A0A4R4W462_9ACTN|nr:M20/M25/M40 family metallo-hydrolase [Nonomuraea diastatica]